MKKIAILGASGYIGKSLVNEFFSNEDDIELVLFSRTPAKLEVFVQTLHVQGVHSIHVMEDFSSGIYDVVLNCTGIGDTAQLKEKPEEIFKVTEDVDNMILANVKMNPTTLYINLSSGAVYGDNFKAPVDHESKGIFNVNAFTVREYYAVAKLHAEAKHRALSHLYIVDFRVFAFFSRFVDTNTPFLMSEIIRCIQDKSVFETNGEDLVRDYISPQDLYSLIVLVIAQGRISGSFDVYSKTPVSKFELLSFLKDVYGLEYIVRTSDTDSSDLSKNIYCSKDTKASSLGYVPAYSSLEGIKMEIDTLGIK